jgi:hypothetical protein
MKTTAFVFTKNAPGQLSFFSGKRHCSPRWRKGRWLVEPRISTGREFHVPPKRDAHASCKVLPEETSLFTHCREVDIKTVVAASLLLVLMRVNSSLPISFARLMPKPKNREQR